ncbi:MAG: hypothetical protein AMJ43_11390, partial [Coxiella sp. DG_40]
MMLTLFKRFLDKEKFYKVHCPSILLLHFFLILYSVQITGGERAIHYTYDNLGRQKEINEERGITTYHYDAEGRIESLSTPEGTINYDYNPITGQKISAYTSKTENEYSYDKLGRLQGADIVKRNGSTVNPAEQTTYDYTPVGSRESILYPNGNYTCYLYDALNRLTSITNWKDENKANKLSSFTYTHYADGMRSGLTEQILPKDGIPGSTQLENHTISYTYDSFNRLTGESAYESTPGDGYEISYEYDLVGNRTQRKIVVAGQELTTTYTYDPYTDRLLTEVHDGPELAFYWHDQPVKYLHGIDITKELLCLFECVL